ncbi:hypothetical protein ACH41E_29685 [Streptomyces sp. NPDC020412]|uniref:hypothetical protein n=1 Tax=Streptomyces sp. NPDC020412 TaxID=3365073 RepID=UPI003798AB6B
MTDPVTCTLTSLPAQLSVSSTVTLVLNFAMRQPVKDITVELPIGTKATDLVAGAEQAKAIDAHIGVDADANGKPRWTCGPPDITASRWKVVCTPSTAADTTRYWHLALPTVVVNAEPGTATVTVTVQTTDGEVITVAPAPTVTKEKAGFRFEGFAPVAPTLVYGGTARLTWTALEATGFVLTWDKEKVQLGGDVRRYDVEGVTKDTSFTLSATSKSSTDSPLTALVKVEAPASTFTDLTVTGDLSLTREITEGAYRLTEKNPSMAFTAPVDGYYSVRGIADARPDTGGNTKPHYLEVVLSDGVGKTAFYIGTGDYLNIASPRFNYFVPAGSMLTINSDPKGWYDYRLEVFWSGPHRELALPKQVK